MRLAFFSPFPPKQTGVAAYSHALVHALRATAEVTAFDHANPTLTAADPAAIDFATHPESLAQLSEWELPIFSLGNNPHYHREILRVQLRTGGLLLLHDTVLYFLFAGLPAGSFYKQFCLNYGADRAGEIATIQATAPAGNLLRYPHPERYPFLVTPVQRAEAVVVHSNFAAEIVRAAAPATPVHVLPHLALTSGPASIRAARAADLRQSILRSPDQILIGTFGFLGPTKRMDSIRQALSALAGRLDLHFVIVGDGPDPLPDFTAAGLEDRVTWLRYVPDEDYDAWIEAADVVLNLRYPSMGESSGTLARAMGLGKACVVTNYATFAEYPDAAVWKIPYGAAEIETLTTAIQTLATDLETRGTIGAAASHYIATERAPGTVASRLLTIAHDTLKERDQRWLRQTQPSPLMAGPIRQHLTDRLHAVLPTHLRSPAAAANDALPEPCALGLTKEDVIWAYRVLLGREPHPESEVSHMRQHLGSLAELRKIILGSPEFRQAHP